MKKLTVLLAVVFAVSLMCSFSVKASEFEIGPEGFSVSELPDCSLKVFDNKLPYNLDIKVMLDELKLSLQPLKETAFEIPPAKEIKEGHLWVNPAGKPVGLLDAGLILLGMENVEFESTNDNGLVLSALDIMALNLSGRVSAEGLKAATDVIDTALGETGVTAKVALEDAEVLAEQICSLSNTLEKTNVDSELLTKAITLYVKKAISKVFENKDRTTISGKELANIILKSSKPQTDVIRKIRNLPNEMENHTNNPSN